MMPLNSDPQMMHLGGLLRPRMPRTGIPAPMPSPLPNPQPIGINDGGPRPVSDPRISPPQPLPGVPGVTPVQPPTLKPANPQPQQPPMPIQPGMDPSVQGLRSPEMGGGGTMSLLDLLRVRQNQQAWNPGPMMRQAY